MAFPQIKFRQSNRRTIPFKHLAALSPTQAVLAPLCWILAAFFATATTAQIPAVSSHSRIFDKPISLSLRELTFANQADTFSVALPDSFVILRSERLFCGDQQLERGRDYRLDHGQARFIWFGNSTECDSLRLSYRILPVRIPAHFSLFELKPVTIDSTTGASAESEVKMAPAERSSHTSRSQGFSELGTNLTKRGSLTRGVSIGTDQALKLDSGLRMQISGEIAEGVEVLASLTDQNTPIQPEGNTQTLQEIDKVSVQLKSRRLNATLGDFEIAYGGSEFGRYSRKLQGGRLEYRGGESNDASQFSDMNVTVSGAVSRGQFTTNEFQGIEGNQGPYQLKGDRGQIDIIVLAGTERVWIDGEQMTRGENNDYVIEYGNGQITFTRRRLITSDSRITVDFQYSDERFRRNLYSLQGRFHALDQKLQWQTTVLREGDDQSNPLGITLTENDLSILAAAGDGLPLLEGATPSSPPNKGNYVRQDSIWVYVGSDSGNHNVTFTDVGLGQGDYRNDGFGVYTYVGRKQGRYLPAVLLTPAKRHEVLDNRLELRPWNGVSIINELALSRMDQNLYSEIGDGDNSGRAWLTAFNIEQRPLQLGKTSLGRFGIDLRYRNKDTRYRDIDRSDVVEFSRRWNLSRTLPAREEILETAINYEPVTGWELRGGGGRLDRGALQKSDRWELGTNLRRPKLPVLAYQIENISRREQTTASASQFNPDLRSDWLRHRGNGSWTLWRFTPRVTYEAEDRRDVAADTSSGFRFQSATGGLGMQVTRQIELLGSYNQRSDDERSAAGLRPKSNAYTQNYGVNLTQWRSVEASLNYTHRERKFVDPSVTATRTDLADLHVQASPFRRAVHADVQYQITNTQASKQERVFFKVREGEGNYRFDPDLNEYVPDAFFGDYVLRLINTENFIPVVEVRLRSNFRLNFSQLLQRTGSDSVRASRTSWWRRYLLPISTETFLRLEEKTQDPQVWEIYKLNLARFQKDATFFGTQSWQQDIHLWENRRERSVRYRLTALRELNNQLLEGGSRRTQTMHEVRLTLALTPKLNTQTELKLNNENRAFDASGRTDRRIRGRQAQMELSYRPRPTLELAHAGLVIYDRDLYQTTSRPALTASGISMKPRVVYSLLRKGRLRSELEWVKVRLTPSGYVLPYEMVNGNREGTTFRWNLAFEYRVTNNVNFSASYLGRREPERPKTLHLGKVEMRAFF